MRLLSLIVFVALFFTSPTNANTQPHISAHSAFLSHASLNDLSQKLQSKGFKNAQANIYYPKKLILPSNNNYPKLRPALFVFNEAQWSIENIHEQLEQTALIYSQCNIQLDQALIVQSNHPLGVVEFNGPHSRLNSPQTISEDFREDIVVSLIPEELKKEFRPFIFYMGRIVNGPENPGGMVAFAYPKYYLREPNRAALNTIWMAADTVYWDGSTRDYRPDMLNGLFLAHEIGHIIGNLQHETELPAHLMSAGPECTRIIPESCKAFLKGGFLF